jgi:hypothetical protein
MMFSPVLPQLSQYWSFHQLWCLVVGPITSVTGGEGALQLQGHHGGCVSLPGHVTRDRLVCLGGRLGELMMGGDLMASCGLRAAVPGHWLDGCLRGGIDPDPLWHRLGEQSMYFLGGDAGHSWQLHAVCQGCTGGGGWWGCWRVPLCSAHLE